MSSPPPTPTSILDGQPHSPGYGWKQHIHGVQVPVNGLITPPESPVEEIAPNHYGSPSPNFLVHPPGPSIVMVGGIGYPPSYIRVMANELAQARQNGEFPQTSTPLMDVGSIFEDYEDLLKLRRARADIAAPAPEAYNHLRVEITRRIQERDASLNEHAQKAEVARRVDTYLHSVEQERRYFEVASNMLQRRGITQPTQLDLDNISEEICSIVESSVEHIEHTVADATGPLRLNMNTFKDQNAELGRQIELQHLQHAHAVKALQSLIDPQSTNLQVMTQNLALASGFVNQLSQVIVDMPFTIDQAISQAVSHTVSQAVSHAVQCQTEEAIKNVMNAQQQAMSSLHAEYDRLRSAGRVEASYVRDVGDRRTNAESSLDESSGDHMSQKRRFQGHGRKGKGKFRKLILKVMKVE